MATETLRDMVLRIRSDFGNSSVDIAQYNRQVTEMVRNLKSAETSLKNAHMAGYLFAHGIRTLISDLRNYAQQVWGVASAIGRLAIATGDEVKEIKTKSAFLGMTTKQYQEMISVLGSAGVKGREMVDIFSQLAQMSMDAQRGSKNATQSFKDLGISVQDLKGKDPYGLFNLVTERFSTSTMERTGKLAALGKLLGEEAMKQVGPLFEMGPNRMQDMIRRANTSGGVLSDEQLDRVAEFNTMVYELRVQWQGLLRTVGIEFMPVLVKIGERFQQFIDANHADIMKQIGDAVDFVSQKMEDLYGYVEKTFTWISANGGLGNVASQIWEIVKAMMVLTTAVRILGIASQGIFMLTSTVNALNSLSQAGDIKNIAALLGAGASRNTLFGGGINSLLGGEAAASGGLGAMVRQFFTSGAFTKFLMYLPETLGVLALVAVALNTAARFFTIGTDPSQYEAGSGKAILAQQANELADFGSSFFGFIREVVGMLWDGFRVDFILIKKFINGISDNFIDLVARILPAFGDKLRALKESFGGIFGLDFDSWTAKLRSTRPIRAQDISDMDNERLGTRGGDFAKKVYNAGRFSGALGTTLPSVVATYKGVPPLTHEGPKTVNLTINTNNPQLANEVMLKATDIAKVRGGTR